MSTPSPSPSKKKILITGAAGFVGQLLARTLLDDAAAAHTLVLTDIVEPPVPAGAAHPERVTCVRADLLTDEAEHVVSADLDAAYLFHGIMSSGAEADFDLGMRVNWDATRHLADVLRRVAPGVKVIYTSSQAVYGGRVPSPVSEAVRATPESSYGCAKMMCEYLLTEYHRRGFLDALVVRLPTISVRPGRPTAAASSFLSGMVREPMQGVACVVPLRDRAYAHRLCSPAALARNLVHALALARDALPPHDRVVTLPGLTVTIQDMRDALARVAGEDALALVREEDGDDAVRRILYSWPADFDTTRAEALGFTAPGSMDDIVREFKATLEAQREGSGA